MSRAGKPFTLHGLTFRLDATPRGTFDLFYRAAAGWEYLSEWRRADDAREAAACFVPRAAAGLGKP